MESTARGAMGQLHCAAQLITSSANAPTIYKDALSSDHWYWGNQDGNPLRAKPLPYYLHKNGLLDYTAERARASLKNKPPSY